MERVSEERENLSAGLGSTKVLNDESERKLVSYFIDSRVLIVFYLCVCCVVGWELFSEKIMAMRKSFKDSLKALEADIQHANTLYLSLSLALFVVN